MLKHIVVFLNLFIYRSNRSIEFKVSRMLLFLDAQVEDYGTCFSTAISYNPSVNGMYKESQWKEANR